MTRPRLKRGLSLRRGLAAVALFVVLAAVYLNAAFRSAAGFGEGAEITRSIGAALFGIDPAAVTSGGAVPAEGFLVALILVAILLDAALDGALMLAKRDDGSGEP
jgi:NADH-quinone oxidoreductase subunit J